ncbi:O-antigen ligase family protein [Sphingomonas sp. BAUL-RG-20F-R05-02]|uniref:O-antigen ligase family protein n=1 Tax=Sphingomonas sp. BAUL-RG-20F-R05-02 TaxID=2914830 RepID=UPI001F5AFA7E|nr:hypothetical protein [Sphingomonas sp. BAUL-RG-20F-R05-02]
MTQALAHGSRAPFQSRRAGLRTGPRRAGTVRLVTPRGAILAALGLLVVSLCYKLFSLGVVVMLALGVGLWAFRASWRRIDPVFVLATLYVADATVTAFMVSRSAGVARTVQFAITAFALLGLYAYAQAARRVDAAFLLKGVGIVSAAIALHLIVWHLLHHHYVTWKYLSDTKLILSLALIPLFGLEDWIKDKARILFPAALLLAFIVILLSGERKALMLFCILFALCRMPLAVKLGMAGVIALTTGLILLDDSGYIHRQLLSASHDYSAASTRYFFTVQSIGDQSDMIREFVNRNARRLFADHPLFGLGATGYWTWAIGTYGPTGLAMNVHGEYHRVPVEGGVFGIAIAIGFLGLALWRAIRHALRQGGLAAPSLDRVPLYCVALLLSYCYAEAVDTAMLLLIGAVGAIVGALPVAPSSLRSGALRFAPRNRAASLRRRKPELVGTLRRRG